VTELNVPSGQVDGALDSINTPDMVQDSNLNDDMSLIELQKTDKSGDKIKTDESLVNCQVQCEMNLTEHAQQQEDLNLNQNVHDPNKESPLEENNEAKSSAQKGNAKHSVTMLK